MMGPRQEANLRWGLGVLFEYISQPDVILDVKGHLIRTEASKDSDAWFPIPLAETGFFR